MASGGDVGLGRASAKQILEGGNYLAQLLQELVRTEARETNFGVTQAC